jgi:hypothetical protein
MTTPRTIVLLGSEQPIAGSAGSHWHAVDGSPAYRRVLLVDDPSTVDVPSFGDGVSVWVGEQIDSLVEAGDFGAATALLAVGQEPAPGHEVEFNAWMDEEHVPGLGAAPGTLSAHRYRSADGSPEYFAVYHLRDLDVNKTPEWKAVSGSERGAANKPHSRKRIRGLYTAD